MTTGLERALAQLLTTSQRLTAARSAVTALETQQTERLRAAKDAGASEAQLVQASGLSRVTVWKRLKA